MDRMETTAAIGTMVTRVTASRAVVIRVAVTREAAIRAAMVTTTIMDI